MLPGVCEPSGSASTSVTMATRGAPDPHSAQTLVGMPASPVRTRKPIERSVSASSFEVSCSCIPSSAK